MIYYMLSYIASIFINRWLYLRSYRKHGENPFGVMSCFLWFAGTVIILISDQCIDAMEGKGWFTPKKKVE